MNPGENSSELPEGPVESWTLDVPTDPVTPLAEPLETPVAGRPGPREEPETELPPPPLPRLLEALLFIGGAPLTAERAVEAIRGLTAAHFRELLDELNGTYRRQGRPYRIAPVEGGFALVLQARYREVLQRLQGTAREARLTQAALDTLAIIAYREPINRDEIDSARGADSSAPLRQLIRLGLIALERRPGDPPQVIYRTTGKFLSLFGLQSRDELPRPHDPQQL